MMTPEEQLRTASEEAGFVRTVSKGMYYKTGEDVDGGFGNLIASCREYIFLGPIQSLEQNFGYTSTQRLVLFLMSKLSVITTFMESRFRSHQTFGDETRVWVVISRSSSRYVDESRHRESENLPEEIAQEGVQDQDKEHSQGEKSEARIPIQQRVWEDTPANEYTHGHKWETQVSKLASKLVRHKNSEKERQMVQFIGNSQVQSS